jgi:hypothetical protein
MNAELFSGDLTNHFPSQASGHNVEGAYLSHQSESLKLSLFTFGDNYYSSRDRDNFGSQKVQSGDELPCILGIRGTSMIFAPIDVSVLVDRYLPV